MVRVGWRIFIANGIANLRRSPRVDGGKENQEQVEVKKTERKQQAKESGEWFEKEV